MANDLEPCPFCSSDNVGLETRRPSGFAYGVCRDCGAEGPCEDHSSSAEDYWNRRPAPVALTDALPELPQHPEKYHNWTAHERAAIQQYAQQCIEARNQQGDTWQPIETAPKDGRTLLLGCFNKMSNWRTMRGQWYSQAAIDDEWEEPDGFEAGWYETAVEPDAPNCWAIAPTYWQPLPAPPAIEQRKADKKGNV